MDTVQKYIKDTLNSEVTRHINMFHFSPETMGRCTGESYREALEAYDSHEILVTTLMTSLKMNCRLLQESACRDSEDC